MLTTDGHYVAIDPTTTPEEYFDIKLRLAGSFTYTAIDDKGAESNAATVALYWEESLLNTYGVGEISMEVPESDLDPTDLWLNWEESLLNTYGVGEISMEAPESDLDPTDLWLT